VPRIEVAIQTHQVEAFQATLHNQPLQEALDLLLLLRGDAYLHEKIAKVKRDHSYNHMIKERPFTTRDLELRKTKAMGKGVIQGKLTANWEGPYLIFEEVRPEIFRVQTF